MSRRIVVGITGASGAVYAKRLIECLVLAEQETHVICSPHGRQLFNDELHITQVTAQTLLGHESPCLTIHPYNDLGSVLASGSFLTEAMIIVPASMNTLGAVAGGLSDNLITRAAQVTLKERRRFVIVPREMPFGHIDLPNMLRISEAGGIICPANPGFYLLPERIDDLVDFVVAKLLDLVQVPHQLNNRWQGSPPAPGNAQSPGPATDR